MRRFKTNILIRNNRLKIMQDNGLTVKYEILSDADYIHELKKKLIEEAIEVLDAKDTNELKSELIDVMEIIEHLTHALGFDTSELSEIKSEKQRKIGKFDHKIKTHHIEMPPSHEELPYYLSKPHKYPEIK
ncbi:MAG: nucleoside triphosphate pyrophosphohydrolase [Lactobacillales bacterium]|jgi:predicted house-cleaning noncanonical NTP pyrophosphatase (MazG superfamily)|nr:nucleoside triphosphate pyrophosphohydrolase [Lactobacillales bacterium]